MLDRVNHSSMDDDLADYQRAQEMVQTTISSLYNGQVQANTVLYMLSKFLEIVDQLLLEHSPPHGERTTCISCHSFWPCNTVKIIEKQMERPRYVGED